MHQKPQWSPLWSKKRIRGWQRMRWLDGIIDSMDMSLRALRADDGQGSLACYSPWRHKESHRTEWLNWTEINWILLKVSKYYLATKQLRIELIKAKIFITPSCLSHWHKRKLVHYSFHDSNWGTFFDSLVAKWYIKLVYISISLVPMCVCIFVLIWTK